LALPNLSFNGAKYQAFRCLAAGGCFAFYEHEGDPRLLVDFVSEHRINYFSCSPMQAVALINIAKENSILFPGLEAFRVSSTLVPEAIREQIQKRLTPNLYIGYGVGEVGIIAIARPDLVRDVPGVVGMLTPGMQAEVIDDDGNPLPPGHAGKVRLKSPGMVSSYVGEPDETARAFRDDWFYSGDFAEFTDDGALIHHGRADDVMIFDGINIYPAEIENTLLRHPAVSEAAAFPINSEAHGNIPVVAVVIKSQVLAEELYSHCRSWLAQHSPQGLVILPRLPRNAAGKVLKHELPKLFRDHQRRNS
jgi:acyl-coenzyme A synthetase/AMP-(fatty) acid ligase